jgi:cysteine synthase
VYMLMRTFSPSVVEKVERDRVATRYVSDVLHHAPIVLFGLERCVTCLSVRAFFDRFGVQYRAVDLDSADYRENDLGSRVRAVVGELTGEWTLPRVFVGGEHVGSAMEIFETWRSGKLQRLLLENGVPYSRE